MSDAETAIALTGFWCSLPQNTSFTAVTHAILCKRRNLLARNVDQRDTEQSSLSHRLTTSVISKYTTSVGSNNGVWPRMRISLNEVRRGIKGALNNANIAFVDAVQLDPFVFVATDRGANLGTIDNSLSCNILRLSHYMDAHQYSIDVETMSLLCSLRRAYDFLDSKQSSLAIMIAFTESQLEESNRISHLSSGSAGTAMAISTYSQPGFFTVFIFELIKPTEINQKRFLCRVCLCHLKDDQAVRREVRPDWTTTLLNHPLRDRPCHSTPALDSGNRAVLLKADAEVPPLIHIDDISAGNLSTLLLSIVRSRSAYDVSCSRAPYPDARDASDQEESSGRELRTTENNGISNTLVPSSLIVLQPVQPPIGSAIVLLSANSYEALTSKIENLKEYLTQTDELLYDTAIQANSESELARWRVATSGTNRRRLIYSLTLASNRIATVSSNVFPNLIAIFQSSKWNNARLAIYKNLSRKYFAFSEIIDKCDFLAQKHGVFGLKSMILNGCDLSSSDCSIMQRLYDCALSIALYRLWMMAGIKLNSIHASERIKHNAAAALGKASIEDAIRVAIRRGNFHPANSSKFHQFFNDSNNTNNRCNLMNVEKLAQSFCEDRNQVELIEENWNSGSTGSDDPFYLSLNGRALSKASVDGLENFESSLCRLFEAGFNVNLNDLINQHRQSSKVRTLSERGDRSQNGFECDDTNSTDLNLNISIKQSNVYDDEDLYLIPISATSEKSLKRAIKSVKKNLNEASETIASVAKRLQLQQHHQLYRKAFVVKDDRDEAIKQLGKSDECLIHSARNLNVIIGSESPQFETEAFCRMSVIFNDFFTRCCEAFKIQADPNDHSTLHQASASYALCKLLLKMGNHNGGVLCAGNDVLVCCAALEILSLEEACNLYKATLSECPDDVLKMLNKTILKKSKIPLKDINGRPLDTVNAIFETLQYSTADRIAFVRAQKKVIGGARPKYPFFFTITSPRDFLVFLGQLYEEGVDLQWWALERPPEQNHSSSNRHRSISSSLFPVDCLEIVLSNNSYLYDHAIGNVQVLSGASLLVLLRRQLKWENVTFENVEFIAPVIFKITDKRILLRVKRTNDDDRGETDVKLFDHNRICLACSAIRLHYRDSTLNDFKNEQGISEDSKRTTAKEFYKIMASYGYQHKCAFLSVIEVRCSQRKGIVRLKSTDRLDVLLDGALQSIVYSHHQESSNQKHMLVPYHIDRISIFQETMTVDSETIANFQYTFSGKCLSARLTLRTKNSFVLLEGVTFMAANFVTGNAKDELCGSCSQRHDILSHPNDINGNTEGDSNEAETLEPMRRSLNDINLQERQDGMNIRGRQDDVNLRGHRDDVNLRGRQKDINVQGGQDSVGSGQEMIAITSFACRLPSNVHDLAEFWDALKIGKNVSKRIPCDRIGTRDSLLRGDYGSCVEKANFLSDDIAEFEPEFFGISKSEAEKMDPQQRILLECVYECMENAGVKSLEDMGMFIGVMGAEYADTFDRRDDVIAMLGSSASVLSGRLSYVFGSNAPSMTIDTACSSSLVALNTAIGAIHQNQCRKAVVAGVNLMLTEQGFGQRANGRMLSEDGFCKAFDARADGYGRADGCVVLLVEQLDTTSLNDKQIYAVVDVNAVNHDGRSISLTAPNGLSQQQLIMTCLAPIRDGSAPTYWEAHGTGTLLGDAIEMKTLNETLEDVVLGSAKTHIGHTEASAGASALLKVALQMRYGYTPIHNHFMVSKNFIANRLRLPVTGEEWEGERAGVSSFGVSGTNAVAVLSKYSNSTVRQQQRQLCRLYHIYPISSKSEPSLKKLLALTEQLLNESSSPAIHLCSMAALNRLHNRYRCVILLKRNKIQKKLSETKPVTQNLRFGISFESNEGYNLAAVIQLFSTYTKYRERFLQVQRQLNILLEAKSFKSMQHKSINFRLIHQCALSLFLNDLGVEISMLRINNDSSLIAAYLFKKILECELEDRSVPSSNMHKKSSTTKLLYVKAGPISEPLSRLLDIKLCFDQQFEHSSVHEWILLDQLTMLRGEMAFEGMIARLYITGVNIRWENFYEHMRYENILPNYRFDKQKYWHCERARPFDHPLLGRVIDRSPTEIVFQNQITSSNNPYLFNFFIDGKSHLPYGACVEIILIAANQLFSENFKNFRHSIVSMSFKVYAIPEKFWMTTKVTKYSTNECVVELTFEQRRISSANVRLLPAIHQRPINDVKTTPTVPIPKFYDELKTRGLRFANHLQVITKRSANGTAFRFTCPRKYAKYVLLDAMFQVLCFRDRVNAEQLQTTDRFIKQEIFEVDNLSDSFVIQMNGAEIMAYSFEGTLLSSVLTIEQTDLQSITTSKITSDISTNPPTIESVKPTGDEDDVLLSKIRAAVDEMLSNGTKVNESQFTTGFTDLGFDSLMITDLANRLRQKYFPGLYINTVDIFDYPNIVELTKLVRSRLTRKNVVVETTTQKTEALTGQSNPTINISELATKDSGVHSEIVGLSEPSSSGASSSTTEEDRIFVQSYFPVAVKNPHFLVTLCDYHHGKRNAIIIDEKRIGDSSYDETTNTWTTGVTDSVGIQKALEHLIDDQNEVSIQFDFHSKFPLDAMTTILLAFSTFILKAPQTFTILSQPGTGQANAFAIGFSKSLAAENYSKIKFLWNFHLERLNVANYFHKTTSATGKQQPENWLITGGLSGIGWQMAQWLVKNRNVAHMLLLGRRSLKESKHNLLDTMRQQAEVLTVSIDISSRTQMKRLFKRLEFQLTGIIHSAGATSDALASRQTREMFDKATAAKCIGLRIISKMCDRYGHHLKYFIVNSSVSAILGNRGQCNYSAANALADEFMRERRSRGLPATTINWGNWLETGMALPVNEQLRQVGFNGITIASAMRFLNFAIETSPQQVIVADLNIDRVIQYRPDLALVFENFCNKNISQSTGVFKNDELSNEDDDESHSCACHTIVKTSTDPTTSSNDCSDVSNCEVMILKSIVAAVEMVCETKISSDDYDTGFMDLGLDSLKAYRFISQLQEKLKCDLNILLIFENPTINRLNEKLKMIKAEKQNKHCNGRKIEQKQTKDCFMLPEGTSTAINYYGLNIHGRSKKEIREKVFALAERLAYSMQGISSIIRSERMRIKDEGIIQSAHGKNRIQLIRNILAEPVAARKKSTNPVLCFMFTGQGSQTWNMGRQLYQTFPFFRETFFMTLSLAQSYMLPNYPKLSDILYEWNMRELLFDTVYAQPIIFCFCYSLAKLLIHFGLNADFFVGHSVSELVAYALSGMVELSDAIRIVVERGRALAALSGKGRMIVVNSKVAKKLKRLAELDVAAENGPHQTVLVGNNSEIDRCIQIANKNGYTTTILDSRYAFHSSLLGCNQLDRLENVCKRVVYKQLNRSCVASNLSGKLMRQVSAKEIIQQTRSTVNFYGCIKSLREAGANTWLEIGPNETLSTLIRGMVNGNSHTVLSSLKPKELEVESLIKTLIELEKVGLNIDWSKVYAMERNEEFLGNQRRFEKLIKEVFMEGDRRLDGLDQHQLNGMPLIPAAFSIFLFACAAGEQKTCEETRIYNVTLKTVVLRKPLNSLHDQELKLKRNELEMFIVADGLTHSECKCSDQMESLTQLTIDDCFERNAQYLDHIGFYERLRQKGLQYGPRLNVVRQIRRTQSRVVAELFNVGSAFILIDGALQVLAAAVFEEENPHIYIPFEIELVWISCDETALSGRLKAVGQINERNEQFIGGDVDVYDHNERLICSLRSVTAIAKAATNVSRRGTSRHNRRRNAIAVTETADLATMNKLSKHSKRSASTERLTRKERSDQCTSTFNKMSHPTSIYAAKLKPSFPMDEPAIGVVGYAGQFAGLCDDTETLWNILKTSTQITLANGRSAPRVTPDRVNLLNRQIEYFDAEFFGISPAEAPFIDPQQRLLLEMTQRTLENACLSQLPANTGVFIAISSSDFAQKAYAEIAEPSAYFAAGTNNSTLAGRIAYWLNISGAAVTIDTACSSFASALVAACDCIRVGHCEMALVGAVNVILNAQSTSVLQRAQMLSPKGVCKVFDADADGYVRSEGVGMVLIRKLLPNERFDGVQISTYAMGHNGRSAGITVPNGQRQRELMLSVIRQANAEKICFIEAHATGTRIGDPIEVRAVGEVFETVGLDSEMRLRSSKSQFGHCEAAAGVASFLTTIMSMENNYVTPNSHFRIRNKALARDHNTKAPIVLSIGEDLDYTQSVLMNCFGFSGSNVSLLLSKSQSLTLEEGVRRNADLKFEPHIVVLSACNPQSLLKMKCNFANYITETDEPLGSICACLQQSRTHNRFRTAAILRNHRQKLEFIENEMNKKWKSIAFCFSERPICMEDILNLCENIAKFDEIFDRVSAQYSRSRVRNRVMEEFDVTVQFNAKLSILIFFAEIGVCPSTICAKNDLDRIVAEVLLRKAKVSQRFWTGTASTTNPNHCERKMNFLNLNSKTVISELLPRESFDCVIDLNRLSIDSDNSTLLAASKRLALVVASLFVHGVDIKWEHLNGLSDYKCRLPPYPFHEVRLWPFHDPEPNELPEANGDSLSKILEPEDLKAERTEVKSLERSFLEEGSNLKDKTVWLSNISATKASNVHGLTNRQNDATACAPPETPLNLVLSKWLYDICYIRCPLRLPSSSVKFIAVNSANCQQIFPRNCISSLNTINNDDFTLMISKHIREYNCNTLVYGWSQVDCEDNVKNNAIEQSMTVIRIWQILDESVRKNLISSASLTVLVLISYSTVENVEAYSTGCIALLRSLAAERSTIAFRYIQIDQLDDRFLMELSSQDSLNEVVLYNNKQRYVQRLRRLDIIDENTSTNIRPINRIIVTGGLGGIGRTIIKMLKPKLAIILSRQTKDDRLIEELQKQCQDTTQIKMVRGDCCNKEDVQKLFSEFAPVDMVFHCAGLVENAMMENMNEQKLERVLNAKVNGTLNLLHFFKQYNVNKIIAFSSAAAILGSAGQTNYALANEIMERLLAPISNGLTLSWGPWAAIGMLAGDEKKFIRKQIKANGWKFLSPDEAVKVLMAVLNKSGHITIMDADFETILKRHRYLRKFFDLILNENKVLEVDNALEMDNIRRCEEMSEEANKILGTGGIPQQSRLPTFQKGFIKNFLKRVIKQVSDIDDIESDVGFMSVGIDSLMIAQMKEILRRELNVDLPTTVFYDRCTVDTLTSHIEEKINECKEASNTICRVNADSEQVAIIGYSGAFSGAANVEEFWQNLLEGKESITFVNSANEINASEDAVEAKFVQAGGVVPDVDKFDHHFWRISQSDAAYLDPQIRKFLEHSYFALEKSGLVNRRESLRIGVVAAAEPSTYGCMCSAHHEGTIERLFAINQKDFLASWTSHLLNLRGPSFGVYSACSSGLLAVVQAVELLRSGQCDVVLAGAASLVLPDAIGHYYQPGMIYSVDGHCRPFDERSGGTVRGSAVGVVVLRLLSKAVRDNNPVLAVIDGYAVNNDGKLKSSFTAPSVSGQTECLKRAVLSSSSDDVEYVECHGTGTKVGDSIELTAMSNAYSRKLYIGSVKANIGHGFAGAGLAGLLKICKIAETKTIPMQINFNRFNEAHPEAKFVVPKTNLRIDKEHFHVAVSSFGIGGTNVHLIVGNTLARKSPIAHERQFHLLPISAKTNTSCIALCRAIAEYLDSESDLCAVAFTLQNHREHFPYRVTIVAETIDDAKRQLIEVDDTSEADQLTDDNIAFFFAPQGVQYARMGELSLKGAPVFRETIKRCCDIVSKELGVNFWDILYPSSKNPGRPGNCENCTDTDDTDRTRQQCFAQCALFSLCSSIVAQLCDWGVECSTMIGHSLGEYSAAVYANVFSLEDAIRILAFRSHLIAKTKNAKMLAIRDCRIELPNGIEISAVLGEHFKCVVGGAENIEKFKQLLTKENIEYRELATEYGFHSSSMDKIVKDFEKFLRNFTYQTPTKIILSNIDGKPIVHYDEQYMINHMRQPVRLDKCIDNLPSNIKVIIEIGPSGILQNLLKVAGSPVTVIETVPPRSEKDRHKVHLLNVVGKLWSLGYKIKWNNMISSCGHFDPHLPNYQFDKIVCWNRNISANAKSARTFRRCWIDVPKLLTAATLKCVLLFLPNKLSNSMQQLLVDFKNRFITYICVQPNRNRDRLTIGSCDDVLQINPAQEIGYQELANHLRKLRFQCSLIVHAWNVGNDFENLSVAQQLEQSFYSILWIKRYFDDCCNGGLNIIAAVDDSAPAEVLTLLGPIRELYMTKPLSYGICLSVSCDVDLCSLIHQLHFSSAKPKFCYVRCDGNNLQEMHFCEAVVSSNDCPLYGGDVLVVLGGCGSVGQAFVRFFCKKVKSLTVILASRMATQRCEESKIARILQKLAFDGQHQFIAYDVDLANAKGMNKFIKQLLQKYSHIDLIVHAAGQATTARLEKTQEDVETVFASKIYGTRNLLNALDDNNCRVNGLIMTSSLSAVLGIYGSEDYAAANIFLDEISNRSFCSIDKLNSIEWCAWNSSTMIAEYTSMSHDEIAQLIKTNSLSDHECERLFFDALQHTGCMAISTANPIVIINEIERIQKRHLVVVNSEVVSEAIAISTIENIITKIWEECLGVRNISLQDNFFQLGGHSLNAMQITWQINKRLGYTSTVNDLFKYPILGDFLTILLNKRTDNSSEICLPVANKLQRLKLTFAQENMFLLRNLHEETLYNIVFSIQFEGNVNLKVLRFALLALTARQTSLRSVFNVADDGYSQECYSLTESYQNIDWSCQHSSNLEHLIQSEKSFVFQLEQIPFRIIAVKTGSSECCVIISQHHIVTDGWSMSIFANELSDFYQNFLDCSLQMPRPISPLRLHLVDYAVWQRSEQNLTNFERDLRLACNRLKTSKATRLLNDRRSVSASVTSSSCYCFYLPLSLKRCLSEWAASFKTTEYVLMLTAFVCTIRKFSDDFENDDVVIGSAVSGRPYEELNSIIGYFLNNIIIKIEGITANIRPTDVIGVVEEALNEARNFEHLPFYRIVAELGLERSQNENPLFKIYFNYRHKLEFPVIEIAGIQTTVCQFTSNRVFDFSCTIDETPKGLKVIFDYNSTAYFSETVIELAKQYIRCIAELGEKKILIPRNLRSLVFHQGTTPNYRTKEHVTELGKEQVSSVRNLYASVSYQDTPRRRTIASILLNQSCMCNSRIAIEDEESSETYETLIGKASSLAFAIKQKHLQEQGEPLRADCIVPICIDANRILIPIIAVIIAGAAFAPLDPQNSLQWNAQLLENMKPSFVISDIVKFENYSTLNPEDVDPPSHRIHCVVQSSPESLVYVIHTSGSTGTPKGVCIAHQNLMHFIRFASAQIGARPGLRIYHSVNTVFDVSCMNIFAAFSNASTLITSGSRLNAASEIVEKRASFAFLTSALFSRLDNTQQSELSVTVEKLFVGGETPSSQTLEECIQRGILIRQIYGPTETTIWSLTNRCTANEGCEVGRVIGIPMGNQHAVLVDKHCQELYGGQLAELAITGDGVARGYLNISSTKFRENIHRTSEDRVLNRNEHMYQTGDLVKKIGSKLLFVGRLDSQLKIRGFRIESIEIEAAIRRFDPQIKNVCVINRDDHSALIAVIEKCRVDEEKLCEFLREILPYYMIPQSVVTLDKIPLNLNGKLDRYHLNQLINEKLAIGIDQLKLKNHMQMTATESMIAQIWTEILQRSDFRKSDNYFICGGHSLSALTLCNRIKEVFDIRLKPTEIFTYPTIELLAKFVEKKIALDDQTTQAIVALRESSDSCRNLYVIHAIAGSIFQYYGILSAIPKRFNVFAIEYLTDYAPRTLVDLAHFYVRQINKHRKSASAYLMGHSLGGILAREMARIMQLQSAQDSPSFVVMLDSWSAGSGNLQIDAVQEYLECQMKLLPDRSAFIDRATSLAKMLKAHQFEISDIKIHLLKAKQPGGSALRRTISGNNSKAITTLWTNGWHRYSTQPIEIYLVDGDHDSMMKDQNVHFLGEVFARIFECV